MEAGNFTISGRLGEGPLGTLYEGVHKLTGDRVILRVLTATLSREPNLLGRLQALMRALGRVDPERGGVGLRPGGRDPALPALLECGRTESGLLFIASERAAGESLSIQLQRHAGLPLPNKALRLGQKLAACLAGAHELGIRHLGLRPSKVLLPATSGGGDSEQVKLLDLGLLDALGRGPQPTELLPAQVVYLAPEQRRGEAVHGGQADVFALGVILYEMGSGGLPAVALADPAGGSQGLNLAAQTGLLQLLPSWLQPFAAILERMLAKDPAERPSMGQVSSTLLQLSSLAPGSSGPVVPASTATPKLPTVAVPGPPPGHRQRPSLPPQPVGDRTAFGSPSPSSASLPPSHSSFPRVGGSLPPSGGSLPPPPPITAPLPSPSMATPKYGMPIAGLVEPRPAAVAAPAPLAKHAPPVVLPEPAPMLPSSKPFRVALDPPELAALAETTRASASAAAVPVELASGQTPTTKVSMAFLPAPDAAAPQAAPLASPNAATAVPPAPAAATPSAAPPASPKAPEVAPQISVKAAPTSAETPTTPGIAPPVPAVAAPRVAPPASPKSPQIAPSAVVEAALVSAKTPTGPAVAPPVPAKAELPASPKAATPPIPAAVAPPAPPSPPSPPTPAARPAAPAGGTPEAETGRRGNRSRRRARAGAGTATPAPDSISDAPTIAPTVTAKPAAGTAAKAAPAPAGPPSIPTLEADDAAPDEIIEIEAEHTDSTSAGPTVARGPKPDPADAPVEMSADYTMSDVPTGVHVGGRARKDGLAHAPTHLSDESYAPVGTGVAETGGTPVEPGVGGVVALHPGQLVGNFRVTSKIGQGGMGAVYAAVHRQIGRRAAVKVLHGPLAKTADYAARFLNEARAVNTVRHPGLVEIFDFGQLPDGTLYIIMEFLEGESLRAHGRRRGPLPEAMAKEFALQIAQALLAAHKNGIVHRDLKPENVMLVVDPVREGAERIKVLDFGIAKVGGPTPEPDPEGGEFATAVGTTMGTPKYMAPEQYGDAAKVDGKADVFALGVMLYEMLSGQVPFAKTSLSAFAEAPRPLSEVQPNVSPQLADLVHRMLSAKADRRPTMAEVIPELQPPPTATAGQTVVAAPPPPQRSPWPWVALLSVVIVGLFGAGAVILRERLLPTQPPSEITLETNDLQLDVTGPRARALGVLYVGLRSPNPQLRAQAVQALGQSRDSAQWTSVASLLKDPDAVVQAAAAEALGVLGAPEAQDTLIQLLAQTPQPGLRVAIGGALSRMQNPRGNAVLRELLTSGDELIKLRAGLLLVETGDLTARPALWAALQKQTVPDDVLLGILSKLAHSGDAQATEKLHARMGDEGFTLRRISAAANLAKIGDERALAVLQQAVRIPGPQQLLASLMLAKVGDSSAFPRLMRVATDGKEPVAARQVAIDGVGACGRRQGALLLTRILDEKTASPELRQSAAGAILQIAGGDPDQIAKQSLGWAQAALGHDSWLVRESATAVLGDIDSDQSVPLLSRALSDPLQAVRRSAAVALGRKRLRAAVLALRTSLHDAEPAVRLAGMHAIGRIIDAIGQSDAADAELSARLHELTETGSPEDKLVAAGTLLQLGDESQRELLRDGLNSPDAALRQLVVEAVPVGDPLLIDALDDQATGVSFAAARRLAGQKVPKAAGVLRAALGQGGAESIVAYGLLKKMGEPVSPPAGFGDLLSRGDLPTSLALLDVAADLPAAEALPLLQKARFDSSPTLRRRVAEVAFALHKRAPSDASLSLLYSLLSDPDVSVRARAGALAAALARKDREPAKVAAPADLGVTDQASPLDQDGTEASVAGPRGSLKVEGEEKVRFQIDRQAAQLIAAGGTEIAVRAGSHRIHYVGGVLSVVVPEGATATVQIPATYADQLLSDAAEATTRREFVRAQLLLDRVRVLVQRSRISRQTLVELGYQQARVHEGLNHFLEAMIEYDRLLKLPESQRKPEYTAVATAAVARLSQHLGRIEVTKEEAGRGCLRTVLWVRPGEHQIDQEAGALSGARPGVAGQPAAPRVIRVREGATVKVELCKGAAP